MVAAPAVFSFHCSACGRCCNSPPQLTLAELFRHQNRFIGCLGLRRVRPLRVGDNVAAGGVSLRAGEADANDFTALAARQGYALPDGDFLMLATQGIDYPSLARCPARGDDQRCQIHAQRPSTCAMVPLDAWTPDGLQQVVLADRRGGAGYIGADCIVSEPRDGHAVLVDGPRVVDAGFAAALTRRRDDEAREKLVWGEAVFRLLAPELLGPAGGIAAVPRAGTRTLALVPALAVLAAASTPSRLRCLAFIDAQLALIQARTAEALARRRLEDRPTTQTLRGFAAALQVLARRLHDATPPPDMPAARQVENYLGI